MAYQRWEHCIVYYVSSKEANKTGYWVTFYGGADIGPRSTHDELIVALGDEGWEMVSVAMVVEGSGSAQFMSIGSRPRYYFKRPKD